MTRLIQFYETGGPEVQRIEEVVVPAPGPGEVRIRVAAIGLNRSDLIFRSGHHPMKPPSPSGNGAEAAGVVESVGAGVSGFAVGEEVCVVPHMNPQRGTYGELINVAASMVMKASPHLTMVENGAFWASYLTAWGGLVEEGKLAAGDFVVIPAASSSVGLAAIQIARMLGAIPIALTGSESKMEALSAAGATHVLHSSDRDLAAQIMAISAGVGARVVFDPVGGDLTMVLASAMAKRGIYVLYGVMAGGVTPFPVGPAFEKLLAMTIFRLDFVNRPEELPRALAFLEEGLARGVLKPVIDSTFMFEEVVKAHQHMASNRQFGKIVLTL